MSTKPTIVPTWDTNGTNSSPPTSGHKTDGFATDEVPASTEINGELNQVGQWCQYLSDGDVQLHDVEVTGTLKVDTTLEIVGAVTLDSTLAVTGAATADSTLDVEGTLTAHGALAVDGAATFGSGATFSGTGSVLVERPLYNTNVRSGWMGFDRGTATNATLVGGGSTQFVGTGSWTWKSQMFGSTGDLLAGLAVFADSSTGAGTISWAVHEVTITGSSSSVGDSTVQSGSWSVTASSAQYLTTSLFEEGSGWEPLSSGSSYYVVLTGPSGTSLSGGVLVSTSQPPPV